MAAQSWRVVLGYVAEEDFLRVLGFTRESFGTHQETIYETTVLAAIAELDFGPEVLGSIARDVLGPGIRSMHVARHGRRGRHVLIYRARRDNIIDIIRLLHDAMDIAQHVPPESG